MCLSIISIIITFSLALFPFCITHFTSRALALLGSTFLSMFPQLFSFQFRHSAYRLPIHVAFFRLNLIFITYVYIFSFFIRKFLLFAKFKHFHFAWAYEKKFTESKCVLHIYMQQKMLYLCAIYNPFFIGWIGFVLVTRKYSHINVNTCCFILMMIPNIHWWKWLVDSKRLFVKVYKRREFILLHIYFAFKANEYLHIQYQAWKKCLITNIISINFIPNP